MSRSHRIVTSPSLPTRGGRSAAAPLFVALALLAPVSLAGCGPLEDLIDDLHHGGGGGSADGGATGPTCGGIAGKACPGMGRCVDNPNDSCDPQKGGADCGGICSCVETVLCTKGSKFDSSPSVCACVPEKPACGPVCLIYCPFGNVLDAQGCPTCACNKPVPGATCPADQCTGPGPKSANFTCPDGKTIGGPACVVDASGVCNWTIVACPA